MATQQHHTLSLHDALPIFKKNFQGGEINAIYENTANGNAPLRTLNAAYGFTLEGGKTRIMLSGQYYDAQPLLVGDRLDLVGDRKSTRLNSSHQIISYAVFC